MNTTQADGSLFLDPDRTLVTVMVPLAPRSTYSTSPPDPTHVPVTVTLRQIADALRKADDE